MILAWNQLGFWRLKVELGTIASIPLIGKTLSNILTGGGGINTTTIVHFYTIHSYILSVVVNALSAIHLIALMIHEREQKGLLLQQLEKLVAPVTPQKQAAKIENSSNKI